MGVIWPTTLTTPQEVLMTGHELDLDARAAKHYDSVVTDHRCRICGEWSPCTVELLRAKLAAAEQELAIAERVSQRNANLQMAETQRANCAENALAAVQASATNLFNQIGFVGVQAIAEMAGRALGTTPERAVGRCVSRGPRISGEGRPICALPAGHAGWHRGDESWTYGGMSAPEWGDLTGKPETFEKCWDTVQ